ncbi:MAG: LysR family transcriptional regulator, partial [Bdellovibrionales bacterium]|nr:LysR family transcriptional regulator [Bdellovibrionales bacterium]
MKNINLEWLKTFDTFARSQNISEAAKTLGISQPAVTLHLKNLENQFELPIFQTIGRKKVMTTFGKELFNLVSAALKDLERKVEHLKLVHSSTERAMIRIGGRRELLEKILMNMNCSVHVKALEFDTENAISKLKTLDLDVAITHYKPDSTDLVAKTLFKEKAKLLVHPKLLKNKKVN